VKYVVAPKRRMAVMYEGEMRDAIADENRMR